MRLFAVVVTICYALALQTLLVCGLSHVEAVLNILLPFAQLLVRLIARKFRRVVVLESHCRVLQLMSLMIVALVGIHKVHQRTLVLCVRWVGFDRVVNI